MKIDITKLDLTQFMAHDHFVAGEVVTLVQPQHIGTKWDQTNKHLRSSVWNYEGELISAGFPKFTNFGENPEHFPVPQSLKNCTVVEKLDGSLLIVSKYKGQLILRTRGTVDAHTMDNGHELEIFKEKFLNSINHATPDTWNVSILFEWVSPQNKIVINYGAEPDWYVVGIVRHDDYSLFEQSELDMWAKNKNFKRPATYTFSDVNDLLENVEQWKGKEGVVIYSQDGQTLHKVKAFEYLKCHAFKGNATFENTIEMFFEFDMPSYQEFETKLIEKFDYECYKMVRGHISTICDGFKEVLNVVDGMNRFVNKIKSLPTRKEQAVAVFSSYGKESNRSSYIFTILDGKSLTKEQLKKLLYQVTKK
jgi:hypothetical protein